MKARSIKCPTCGKQHVAGFAFCQRCGAALDMVPEDSTIPTVYTPAASAAVDEADESEFRALSRSAAREITANRRAGCAGMLAILSTATAIATFLRARF